MKKNLFYFLAVLLFSTAFSSCEKDEVGIAPKFISGTLSDDNKEITVVFDQMVYANNDKTGNLEATNFTITVTGGTLTNASYTVAHISGSDEAILTFEYEGKINGQEVITIIPKNIYGADGIAMDETEEVSITLVDLGIVGEWYSSGTNVAFLLTEYFNVDSIYAKFEVGYTYLVESYDPDGVKTEYKGTFVQTKSSTDDIWTITLNQSAPSAGASEGIFEIYFDISEYDMQYEIVQTEPEIGNTSPTPEAGFGSSNGGALGVINIQKYKRLSY